MLKSLAVDCPCALGAAEGQPGRSGAIRVESLERIDAAHRSRASGCLEQLRLALHESGGGREKSISLRRSERAGHAAAIYYSLVESCKANSLNPLTYLTYILSNA